MNIDEIMTSLYESEEKMLAAYDDDNIDLAEFEGKTVKEINSILNSKVDAMNYTIKKLEAQALIHDTYKKMHDKKKKHNENAAERVRDWVKFVMRKFNIKKIVGKETNLLLVDSEKFVLNEFEISPRLAFKLNAKYKNLIKINYAMSIPTLKKLIKDNEDLQKYGNYIPSSYIKSPLKKGMKDEPE